MGHLHPQGEEEDGDGGLAHEAHPLLQAEGEDHPQAPEEEAQDEGVKEGQAQGEAEALEDPSPPDEGGSQAEHEDAGEDEVDHGQPKPRLPQGEVGEGKPHVAGVGEKG